MTTGEHWWTLPKAPESQVPYVSRVSLIFGAVGNSNHRLALASTGGGALTRLLLD